MGHRKNSAFYLMHAEGQINNAVKMDWLVNQNVKHWCYLEQQVN
jgi:hypothetical protein